MPWLCCLPVEVEVQTEMDTLATLRTGQEQSCWQKKTMCTYVDCSLAKWHGMQFGSAGLNRTVHDEHYLYSEIQTSSGGIEWKSQKQKVNWTLVRVPSQNGGRDPACVETLRHRSEPIPITIILVICYIWLWVWESLRVRFLSILS